MPYDAELVGGVLVDAADPVASARTLAQLVGAGVTDPAEARAVGFEPELVAVIRRRYGNDTTRIEHACALGAAWVMGRRSVASSEPWDLVASLPSGTPLPYGLRRTTAETLIRLVAESTRSLRLVAPFIDWPGLSFLADGLSAATARGVTLRILLPTRSTHATDALDGLAEAITRDGNPGNYSIAGLRADAPWAHLKVLSSDATSAYIGSANVTGAGIAGRNLELGVLVRGPAVAAVEDILDIYTER
jgi:hypothetical protein